MKTLLIPKFYTTIGVQCTDLCLVFLLLLLLLYSVQIYVWLFFFFLILLFLLYFFIALCQSISLTHSCFVVYTSVSRCNLCLFPPTSVSLLFPLCCLTAFTTPFFVCWQKPIATTFFFFFFLRLHCLNFWFGLLKSVSQLSWYFENQRCYPPEHKI